MTIILERLRGIRFKMFCSVCSSKKVESTISVWYLDRKQGEFPSLLGRKGALEFCGGHWNQHSMIYTDVKFPATIRITYRCSSCGHEKIENSVYCTGSDFQPLHGWSEVNISDEREEKLHSIEGWKKEKAFREKAKSLR